MLASAEGLTTSPKEPGQLMQWDFGTNRYIEIMSRRPQYIARFLDAGCSVLFTDIDVVWKGNVISEIQSLSGGSGDMYATLDQGRTIESDKKTGRISVFNGGLIFFQPTEFTKKVVHKWAEKLKAHPNRNQPMLNAIIHKWGLEKVMRLLRPKFLDGRATPEKAEHAVAVHANFMTGHDAKVAFLRKIGLWVDLPPLTNISTEVGPGVKMPTVDFAERVSKLQQISPIFKGQEVVQAEHKDTNETAKTHADEAPSSEKKEKKAATEKPQSGEASSRDEVQKTESGHSSLSKEGSRADEEHIIVFHKKGLHLDASKAAGNSSIHPEMLSNESHPKSAKPQSGDASSRDEVQETASGHNSSLKEGSWPAEDELELRTEVLEEAKNSHASKAAGTSSTHPEMLSNESHPKSAINAEVVLSEESQSKSAPKAEQPSEGGQSKLATKAEVLSKESQSKSATKAEEQLPRKQNFARIVRSEAHRMFITDSAVLSETSGF